ncbi:hypothetical protein VB711_24125 [Cronbergia sp. UHCC 0137]|uniref:hypothetical protein n=1 Tax=Cronbergia sp. UHCC 0137 TaxID=3110239 RepID=UPI002B1F16FF|nr:hypothetical protein [Cronbergia sp. UHCC 0137]MEA5620900.1 hypothetical protein [Cronbergia sp. UHCC 0137]
MNIKFRLIFTSKAQKQLDALAHQDRKQYHKAFQILSESGSSYRSLRTHRYQTKSSDIWSSSASMAKRFYWHFSEEHTIVVTHLDSH